MIDQDKIKLVKIKYAGILYYMRESCVAEILQRVLILGERYNTTLAQNSLMMMQMSEFVFDTTSGKIIKNRHGYTLENIIDKFFAD